MYERLTQRTENGGVKFSNGEYWNTVYPQNDSCLNDIHRMAIRLCEIEDKIQEGKIVELPCDLGSEVYFADGDNKSVWEGNLVSFSLDAAHLWFNCHYKCGLNIWHPIEDFGKTVFLTLEEANKKLKGLENEQQ